MKVNITEKVQETSMKKVSTADLVTMELESYLDGILTCCDLDGGALDQYVTGKALDLLKRLPKEERPYAIGRALGTVDYNCVNDFPYNQYANELLLPPTEFEIDITDIVLENPDDFYIKEGSGRKLAYYALNYGAFIALDIDRLEEYVNDYLAEN